MAYAIFGDSYVEHLRKFTRGDMRFKYDCSFYGVSGMATDRKFQAAFDQLCLDRPRYVFIILGGNDIKDSCTPDGIFKELKRIVEELKMCGVEKVFVSSIMERRKTHPKANISVKDFNKVRRSVNEKLKKYLRCDYVDTAKRLIYPRHYDRDLIHPGVREGGLLKLRHAVLSAFAKTIPKSVVLRK